MLVLDGHESHISAKFKDYYEENNIITLCLLSHSSHLTQPLDVGCFSILKKRYGVQIEHFIKAQITYISKDDFLLAFKMAFLRQYQKKMSRAVFRGLDLSRTTQTPSCQNWM